MSNVQELASMIDHTILHPQLTDKDLEIGCQVAAKYNVASVCVKPFAVDQAKKLLAGTAVKVGCVVGFPGGISSIDVKVYETVQAIKDGAQEIDMVINIGKAMQKDWAYLKEEIKALADACHERGATLKVIFETDYITEEESIVKLCQICTEVEADYVKTSTGFGFVKGDDGRFSYEGATDEVLKLMKASVGPNVKIKASGGIRSLKRLLEVKEIGCHRAGATATIDMLEEAMAQLAD
ncbi:deoxyribose-phosphate aldolase [Persicobacter diffluens]